MHEEHQVQEMHVQKTGQIQRELVHQGVLSQRSAELWFAFGQEVVWYPTMDLQQHLDR